MKRILILAGIIALIGAWYAFRPEKLFIAKEVNESFPAATQAETMKASAQEPAVLVQGNFHSVAHDTKGVAAIYELANGERVLRFSNFETSNGPAVNVYLVAANDATDNDTVKNAGFISLGPIKGSKGDQNYSLPKDTDLNKYKAVTIWCQRFGVNFGTAPLSMGAAATTMASNEPVVLKQGQFHGVAHETKGEATIYELADGKRVLRFSQFETSNGPAVQIYLVAADDATDSDMVKKAGFISLGPIKGSKGDQNYELPAGTDLTKYRAVTVWCERFGVNFGTAPLMEKETAMAQKRS